MSLGADDELTLIQPIEGHRVTKLALGTSDAAPLAIAFWVKAHRTGTYSGAVKNTNVGGGSPRSYPFAFTVNSADTWEYKTATISQFDTGSTWGLGEAAGLYLALTVAAGSARVGTADAWAGSDYSGASGTTNGVAATSDTFQVTGAIVLPGIGLPTSGRAAFFMRTLDFELLLCRRYWEKSYNYDVAVGATTYVGFAAPQGFNTAGGQQGVTTAFAVETRSTPTYTFYDGTGNSEKISTINSGGSWSHNVSGAFVADSGKKGMKVVINGVAYWGVGYHWTANARL